MIITKRMRKFSFLIHYNDKEIYDFYTYDEIFRKYFYSDLCLAVKNNNEIGYIPCFPLKVVKEVELDNYISPLKFYKNNTLYCFLYGLKDTLLPDLYKYNAYKIDIEEDYSAKINDLITITISTNSAQLFGLRKKIYIKDATDVEKGTGDLAMVIDNTELVLGEETSRLIGGNYISTIHVQTDISRPIISNGYSKVKFSIITEEDESLGTYTVYNQDGTVKIFRNSALKFTI